MRQRPAPFVFGLLGAIALGAAWFGHSIALARPGAETLPPSTIVSINLSSVLSQLEETKAVRAALEARDAEIAAYKEQQEALLARMRDELEALEPTSEDYKARQEAIFFEATNLEAWLGSRSRIRALDESLEYVRLYEKIVQAAGEVAEAQEYDFIILDDSDMRIEPGDPAQTIPQLFARRMIYANPRRDVTGEVVDRLNNAFQTGVQ